MQKINSHNNNNRKDFYAIDWLDRVVGIVAALLIVAVLCYWTYDGVTWPMYCLTIIYIAGIVVYGIRHKNFYRAPLDVLKIIVDRLGWFLTMGL